jgi:cellulose 1,4-beta-cellobiosidase
MKVAALTTLAIATLVSANPSLKRRAPCTANVTLSGNPFTGRKLHANNFYRKEVEAAAAAISDSSLKAQALKVADIGTFIWMFVASVSSGTPS